MVAHLFHQLPPIGPIDPDQTQLFTGPAESGKEQARPRRVRHRGSRDDDGQEESQRIHQDMPFAAFDIFAFIVAPLAPEFGRLHTLAIEATSGGVFVASCLLAYLSAQGIVEPLPVPAVTPWAAIPIDTGPLRIFMGEQPPFDAPIDDIKERIDHRAHIELAMAPTRLGWRDQIFDKSPFGISEVCRVWFCSHPSSVPN